jgi:hypothetical protein
MADYGIMLRKMLEAGGRVSSNVQDFTSYPPRVSPHSGSGAHFYDPESEGYRDLRLLALQQALMDLYGREDEVDPAIRSARNGMRYKVSPGSRLDRLDKKFNGDR